MPKTSPSSPWREARDDAADELKNWPRTPPSQEAELYQNRLLERGSAGGNCGELQQPSPSYTRPS